MYKGATDCCNSRKCYYCDVRYCMLANPGILQTCQECEQYHGLTKPMYIKIKTHEHRMAQLEHLAANQSAAIVSLTQIMETQRDELERLKRPRNAEANILNL